MHVTNVDGYSQRSMPMRVYPLCKKISYFDSETTLLRRVGNAAADRKLLQCVTDVHAHEVITAQQHAPCSEESYGSQKVSSTFQ